MERRAKIVATVGPKSADRKTLARLMRAGADVMRLNLSHGSAQEHRETIARIREVEQELGCYVGIVADLMGPRYRLGELSGEVFLKPRQEVTLGCTEAADLPLDNDDILRYVRREERLLIDNGLVELRVLSKRRGMLRAKVIGGGAVSARKGINLPDTVLPFRVSEKDRADISMAVAEGADFIGASYVGRGDDLVALREEIEAAGGDQPIVAKLERARAIDHLDEIVSEADAVMVARGDLGVEVPLHRVPVIQKRIIDAGWRLGKPVVVATQMLESMIEHPRPTRAESTDVANAVFDGADAMMLSGETAIGAYPVEAVKTMHRIILAAEAHLLEGGLARAAGYDVEPPSAPGSLEIPETIAAAAVLTSKQLGARRIVALTQGGFTVRTIARRRPSTPVIALTQVASTARRTQLVWGVRPLRMQGRVEHHDEVVGLVDRHLLAARLARVGDRVAILMGDPIQARPPTNLLRLHHVRKDSAAGSASSARRKRK